MNAQTLKNPSLPPERAELIPVCIETSLVVSPDENASSATVARITWLKMAVPIVFVTAFIIGAYAAGVTSALLTVLEITVIVGAIAVAHREFQEGECARLRKEMDRLFLERMKRERSASERMPQESKSCSSQTSAHGEVDGDVTLAELQK